MSEIVAKKTAAEVVAEFRAARADIARCLCVDCWPELVAVR